MTEGHNGVDGSGSQTSTVRVHHTRWYTPFSTHHLVYEMVMFIFLLSVFF